MDSRRARPWAVGFVVIAAATLLSYLLGLWWTSVSALIIAIVVGAIARNVRILPASALPGIKVASPKLLRTGVVLLGLQLSITAVMSLGMGEILVILVTVAVTFGATLACGRALKVSPALRMLIATGFSICGASAVAAMASVVPEDSETALDDDVATAIALVTLYGSIAVLALPLLGQVSGFDDELVGVWIGASVHEVGQVVAAATAVSAATVAIATVTKLGRVVLLAPMVALTSIGYRGMRTGGSRPGRRPPVIPLFVVGFLVCVAIRSWAPIPEVVYGYIKPVTTVLLTGAMFCLGTGVDVRALVRTGGRAALLGGIATVVAITVSGVGLALV